ncbi:MULTISPECIES: hypothetical protein [Methanobrevibacter]|uniref:Uncharacterized protein n=1 Tax=Methanobrevibacter gottschalkii DSM 11977 TaxID=1122229 RepID=A0A3N5C3Q6_9EURY|nr:MULTISPECIES: hypothetical protein [Methanobrevibacter]OEC93922.1 hypothetical protein A9505_01060 [Methanobrevibacter sp. A27]RPF52745.1 hypothetical protein EDC42_0300 [Methanobrevibacter gottschalkii DSM 11977]
MLDEKGYFYIIDAILAVILVSIVFLVVNTAISIPSPDYSYDSCEFRTAQDVMEILSGKVNFTDRTFIGEISKILKDNKNSKESINLVSKICKNKFKSLNLTNYRFTENKILKEKILDSSGDYSKSNMVSVATRNYDDYSYTLSVW